MPLQIPLSQAGDPVAFKARVEAFRQVKLGHHATAGEPAPRASAPDDDANENLTQDTVAGLTPAPFPEA